MCFNLYLDLTYKYSGELDSEDNLVSDGDKVAQCRRNISLIRYDKLEIYKLELESFNPY